MKNTKKVLSVVLAVIMAFSALTLVAFAHTYTGEEDANSTSVKYEVAQVASATDVNGGTYTAVDNDIYAVTVYAKAKAGTGISYLAAPIQYDKTKFAPMMLVDGTDLYAADYDDWFVDTDLSKTDFYKLPERFEDDKMYKAGAVVTNKVSADCFGLTNSNAGPLVYNAEVVCPGDVRYSSWIAGLDSDTIGIMFFQLDLIANQTAKTAFLNTENGVLKCDDYLEMITVYFKRIDGVSEADCYGASFGISSADDFGTQLTSYTATTAGWKSSFANAKAPVNYISAAVESPVKALATLTAAEGAKSQQIMFNLAEGATAPYSEDSIASVDYRFVAQFSTSAYPIDYNEETGKINDTDIDEVGFVMAKQGDATAAELTALSAADVAALSKTDGTIRKCWTAKVSTDMAGGASFAFSCRIAGIAVTGGTVAAEYLAVPYVIANGDIAFGQVMTSGVQTRYDTYVDTFLAKKNA